MENGLLKEKHAIGLLLLEISCVAGIFCRGNWTDVKTKNYGGGGEGRRQWEWPPATNPLRFMKGPFQSCERRSWLTCDVTCFEVWRQPSHNVKQTVAPNSLTLSLLFFFYHCLLLIIKEKKLFIGMGFHYWTQRSTFRSKDWIFLIEVLFEVKYVDHWHTIRQIIGKISHAKRLMASVDFAKEMCRCFFSFSRIFLVQKQHTCF